MTRSLLLEMKLLIQKVILDVVNYSGSGDLPVHTLSQCGVPKVSGAN